MNSPNSSLLSALITVLAFLILAPLSFAQEANWTQSFPTTSPSPRFGAAMAYDSAHGQIVLFGGAEVCGASCRNILADTWIWDGANWTQKFPAVAPPSRTLYSMVYDTARSQMVLFGGFNASLGPLNDTWVWDGSTWAQKFPSNIPAARYDCEYLAYDSARQQVVMFGCGTSADTKYNDTWVWDGSNWTQQFPAHVPPARSAQQMAYDAAHQQIVLFGGGGVGGTSLDDTWTWDGTDWTQRFPAASPTTPRWNSTMAYDAARGNVLLFGGSGPLSADDKNDTWVWDGTNWTPKPLNPNPLKNPAPRLASGMAYDSAHQQVVLFGGVDGSTFDDTWLWGIHDFPIFTGRSTEPSIAVDPHDQTHAVVGFNDESIQGSVNCGWAESRNGGPPWTQGTLQLPSGFTGRGDPWVRYSSNGHLYYSCIGATPWTDSLIGFHTRRVGIFVAASSTGLASDFGIGQTVTSNLEFCRAFNVDDCKNDPKNADGEFTDHPAIGVLRKPDGTDRIVVCWIDFFSPGKPQTQPFVRVAFSDDGQHWHPTALNAQGASCMVGGSDSQIGVSWRAGDKSLMISTSGDGSRWSQPFVKLAATTPLVEPGDSTMSAVLSQPYAFLVPGQSGLRAVWQVGGPPSQIFVGNATANSPGDSFQDPDNTSVPFAGKFLPGAGACGRLAGGYEVTTLSGGFRYKVWRIDGAGPIAPIFTSTADLNPQYGDSDSGFPGFSRVGDYTSVDCSGSLGWAAWTDLREAKPEIWGGVIPIP